MKIVTFQSNRTASAITQGNTHAKEGVYPGMQLISNRFIAERYEDRFLWEEAACLRPQQPKEYCISGNWQ
jgi:hypothetical protein